MAGEKSELGIRRCLKCDRLFVSQDVLRLRRCNDCKSNDEYVPRTAAGLSDAARSSSNDT